MSDVPISKENFEILKMATLEERKLQIELEFKMKIEQGELELRRVWEEEDALERRLEEEAEALERRLEEEAEALDRNKKIEMKRAKVVACKERKKLRKFEERKRNRLWKEATTFTERYSQRMNADSQSGSWSLRERLRIETEIRAEISREFDELVENMERVSAKHVVKKFSGSPKSTNDSA